MIHSTKKKLQLLFKKLSYWFFKLAYGNIQFYENYKDNINCKKISSEIDGLHKYNVYFIKNARLYTDTINNCAIINNKRIISGPSYQIKDTKFLPVEKNIVFSVGTPRIKKKIKGTVLSLLTGGAGNYNYWHWIFDVLPRLNIVKQTQNLDEIDFYLFPNINNKYQKETIEILNIPFLKFISSIKFRHIECEKIIVADHPYVIKNNATDEIQNLPNWIIEWLKINLTKGNKLEDNNFPKKIYINRKDASANVSKRRKIINEEEVIKRVESEGYVSVQLSDYHFKDQIKLFHNAKKIVGLHGAGFANVIFSTPNTKMIELKPFQAGKVCENLAKKCNLDYDCISVVPEKYNEKNQMGNITININDLEKKL